MDFRASFYGAAILAYCFAACFLYASGSAPVEAAPYGWIAAAAGWWLVGCAIWKRGTDLSRNQ